MPRHDFLKKMYMYIDMKVERGPQSRRKCLRGGRRGKGGYTKTEEKLSGEGRGLARGVGVRRAVSLRSKYIMSDNKPTSFYVNCSLKRKTDRRVTKTALLVKDTLLKQGP